jgi:hypothetical protein
VTTLTEVFDYRGGLDSTARMTLAALAWSADLCKERWVPYGDRERVAAPTKKALSEATGLGSRSIQRGLRTLEQCGFIRPAEPAEDPWLGCARGNVWVITPAESWAA